MTTPLSWVLNGIQGALEGQSEFEVVGVVMDGVAAVELVEALKPDLLLLDVSMPGMSGIEVAYKVREASPETRVLVYIQHGCTKGNRSFPFQCRNCWLRAQG